MALQSSGAIALDDMHVEVGGTTGSTVTINDADIRGLIDASDGATTSFDDWYGASDSLSGDIGVFDQSSSDSGGSASKKSGYVIITSLGNAEDFADTVAYTSGAASHANATRGIIAGGEFLGAGYKDQIQYTTIASQADFADFGDLSTVTWACSGVGNSTRMCISGGSTNLNFDNKIEYITIGSTGNASDFGDQSVTRYQQAGNVNSTTRGCYTGGAVPGVGATSNIIDYITIGSTGNATDFGNLNYATVRSGGCSSSTRGVISDGVGSTNRISYFTIASTGNAADFGNMTANKNGIVGCSNATRGLFGGNNARSIDYITIASTGNAADFGDLLANSYLAQAFSNSHGGL
jgi:hypothetical protein